MFGTGFSSTGQRKRVFLKRNKVSEFIVDETVFKVGNEFVILWIAIEPSDKMQFLVFIFLQKEPYYLLQTTIPSKFN